MADFVAKLGKTRLGYWLWKSTRRGPLRPVVDGATGLGRAAERALRRREPANRAHDRRQRAILSRFEAETRAKD